jgi:hypothetical protein
MRSPFVRVAVASLVSSLLAITLGLLMLLLREAAFGTLPISTVARGFGHTSIVAFMLVWPLLAALAFLIGVSRWSAMTTERPELRRVRSTLIGCLLGAAALAAFWRFTFGVGVLEVGYWVAVGAFVGALCGQLFDRVAFKSPSATT